MSLRWLQLKSLLRPHMSTQVDVVQMLTRLCWFQEAIPLGTESRLPATLSIFVLPTTRDPSHTPPRSQWDVPLHLWTAVLPWECGRGLSAVPPKDLLPAALLEHVEGRTQADHTPVAPSAPTLAADGEGGMLFVQDVVDAKQPTCFWSGAITMPIDVMFLQRVDPFSGTRFAAKKAIGGAAADQLSERSLRGDGLQLVAVDYQKLEPFPSCDRVQGSPLEALFPDLYSNSTARHQQHQPPPRRVTEATSRANSIALVLETRRACIRDHVTHALSHAPRIAPSPSSAAAVDTSLLIELILSDDMHREIEEKRQLQATMVATLESAIRSELARLHRAVDTSSPSSNSEPARDAEAVNGWAAHVGTGIHGDASRESRDEDANVPTGVVRTSFVGRRTHESNNNGKGDCGGSARKQARYPNTSPGYYEQPKLDYALVVLSFKLGLCVQEIMALGSRMVREMDGGLLDATDVAWLLHLVNDPSLVVPDELSGAIRLAAKAVDVQARHPLTCDWEKKVASMKKMEATAEGADEEMPPSGNTTTASP